jgi:UDP-N-acetylmuramoyl-tripeptide--D-alanyl-D-alanine ligase
MVELGKKHDEAHAALGAKAADKADIALVIRADRIPTFAAAFRAHAPQKPLHEMANLAEARKWLQANLKTGDVYLIENDLPDQSEAKLSL